MSNPMTPDAIKALRDHLSAMCRQYRNLCEIHGLTEHSTTWLEDSEALLQSLTADAGEARKIECKCPECPICKPASPGQGVCVECKGAKNVKRTVNTENYGEQDFWDICGACNGSGKAPTVSPGNSKDGWLSEKDILWWIEMFESGKALREKEPFAFERVAIPVLKMALTASSQEKRK